MKKITEPKLNAEQIALCKRIDKQIKAGRFIFVRDEAHEMEIFEEQRLKQAIAGTKKKK